MNKIKKNNSKKNYYGTSKNQSQSYLEFGSKNLKSSKKNIWDYKTDQGAYDLFMVARYSRELIAYKDCLDLFKRKKLKNIKKIYEEDVHTKDFLNSLLTWSALTLFKKQNLKTSFFEIGFTLFGCIESHELCRAIVKKGPNINSVNYSGTEISKFISEMALSLHSKYIVSYQLTNKKINYKGGVFFAKGVTLLYAIKKANELFRFIDNSNIAIFDYSFSLNGKDQHETLGTGKEVVYLDIKKIFPLIKKSKKILLIRKSDLIINKKKNRIRCYFLWGRENLLKEYLIEANKNLLTARKNAGSTLFDIMTNKYQIKPSDDYINIRDMEKLRNYFP